MSTRAQTLGDRRSALVLLPLVFAAACLTLGVAAPGPTSVVTWWPAAGVAVMLVTLTPRSWWWWLVPLAVMSNASANLVFGRPVAFALVLSAAVGLEAVIFALVMRHRPSGLATMATQRDFVRLAAASGSAALAGGLLCAALLPTLASGSFSDYLVTITPSHAAAILILAPIALSWRRPLLPIRGWELALQSTALAVVAVVTFGFSDVLAMTFVPLPLLVWAAFKFGLRVVAWQLAFVALVATVATALARGPFAVGFGGDNLSRLAATSLVQTFLVCVVLICVPLAVNVEQTQRLTDQLRASSDLFRRNFSEALVAMLVLRSGADGLEIFDVNQPTADLLGSEVDSLVGGLLEDLLVTDTPLDVVWAKLSGGEIDSWRDEGTLPGRPGSRVALSIARLSGEGEQAMYSAQLLDLTNERQALASLQAERQLSEMTLATTACLILVTDMDGHVLRANPAVSRILGFEEKDLVGTRIWEKIVPPQHQVLAASMFAAPDGVGVPRSVESSTYGADGVERRIAWTSGVVDDEHGNARYIVMTGLDITSERNAAGLMQHLLQAAVSTALIGLDVHGRVTLFNTGAQKILRRAPFDSIGVPLTDLLADDDLDEWARRTGAEPSFGGLVAHLVDEPPSDWHWERPDGDRVLVSMTITPVTDNAGVLIGYLCVGSDITEVRETQELLANALDKERQVVERLRDLDSAKDEFVSTVSHELRTPVSSIIGYTELLADGDFGDLSPEQTPVLSAINRNGERLVNLVDNLLALSGLTSGSLTWEHERVDLVSVLRTCEHALQPSLAQRRLAVSFAVPEHPVVVQGDASQLERVISNLLSNAVKFTEDGGEVSCRIECRDGTAHLVVMDTGLGIPREEQDNLFGRFWRSSTSQSRHIQGTGLGLAIVQAIVSTHGGTVSIESEHMEGTTVQVALPLHHERTARVTATA